VKIPQTPNDEQIVAILGPDVFKWAVRSLPDGVDIDDVRFRDLISVTEEDLLAHVTSHGFDQRVVAENAVVDDHICIVQADTGWRVFYTERGIVSEEAMFGSRDEARHEVVRRLMRLARIMLNHRYWHAHNLEFPCGDD
jgi:hypothetical protein